MAGRKLDAIRRRPPLHAEAAPGRHVLRRPPVHGRRCGVFVRGGLRRVHRLADSLQIDGKRLEVSAIDPLTVVLTFPVVFAPGLRMLDNLPILPRHKLEAALKPGRSIGVGPGHAAVRDRRPRPVRAERLHPRAADGVRAQPALLPQGRQTAARCRTSIGSSSRSFPDQNAELLRLDVGAIDMTIERDCGRRLRPAQARGGRREAAASRPRRRLRADAFWINLKPGAFAADPRAAWLQRDELRQAISLAVDRQAVRRHGVPRRRRAGVRPDHAGEQELVLGRGCRARRTIRPARRQLLASIGLDRSQRRRPARGRRRHSRRASRC